MKASLFVVPMKKITGLQLKYIFDHIQVAQALFPALRAEEADSWTVQAGPECVQMSAFESAFDMYQFLLGIGIDKALIRKVEYGSDYTGETKDGKEIQ